VSAPRPHPLYFKPRHVKKHFKVTTSDGWKLHLIRYMTLLCVCVCVCACVCARLCACVMV
jgi:hypothetical protein